MRAIWNNDVSLIYQKVKEMKNNKMSTIKYLIVSLEELFSGYDWTEIKNEWKDIYSNLLNRYDPINELEYQ